MVSVTALQKILKQEFGITNEKELDEAIRNIKPLNIGVFVSLYKPKEEVQSKVLIEKASAIMTGQCYV
ncbi:MAG: hypothetical protein RR162_00060 [Oscillospiraceae bacterium]